MAKAKRGLAKADRATRQRVSGEGGKVRAERMKSENNDSDRSGRSILDRIFKGR